MRGNLQQGQFKDRGRPAWQGCGQLYPGKPRSDAGALPGLSSRRAASSIPGRGQNQSSGSPGGWTSSGSHPDIRRVSPELGTTQGVAHSRGFINICQMSEEFSQPKPGSGRVPGQQAPALTSQAAWIPSGGVCPHPGDPQSELQERRKWGEGMGRGDASFCLPRSHADPNPNFQSPAWAREFWSGVGNWGGASGSRDCWLRQGAGHEGSWLLSAP